MDGTESGGWGQDVDLEGILLRSAFCKSNGRADVVWSGGDIAGQFPAYGDALLLACGKAEGGPDIARYGFAAHRLARIVDDDDLLFDGFSRQEVVILTRE